MSWLGTYLYSSIAFVSDLDTDPLPARVEFNMSLLRGDQSSGSIFMLILGIVEGWKGILGRDRKIATIKSFAEIPFVAADGLVDRDQMCARRKSALNLQLLESCKNAWIDMAAAENLLSE